MTGTLPTSRWLVFAFAALVASIQCSKDKAIDAAKPPRAMYLIGQYDTPGFALGVAGAGSYAYVADGYAGVQIVDLAVPSSPALVGNIRTAGEADFIFPNGDYLYMTDGELRIIDIADRASPQLVSTFDCPTHAAAVYVSGQYAYLAAGFSGLISVNISDPAHPTGSDTAWTYGVSEAVIAAGTAAFVGGGFGLEVFDISSPGQMVLDTLFLGSGYCWDMFKSGNQLYLATDVEGLSIVDVTNPANPALEGSFDTPGIAEGIWVSGGYAFVADADSGLQVIDVADPSNPTLAFKYRTPGKAHDICMLGYYTIVAADTAGILVLQFVP